MRGGKDRERGRRGWGSSCRKAVFCSGLTTSSRFLGRPRGFDMIHDNPFPYLYNLFMTQETRSHPINGAWGVGALAPTSKAKKNWALAPEEMFLSERFTFMR